jgi:cobyrinic acid a,c-diamide synthase
VDAPPWAASVPSLLISAAHKSSGKTTVTLGLCAALRSRGLAIAPFKKGPDYIDPMWLARASGRPCYNLDPHLMTASSMSSLFVRRSAAADLAIVEGNKGLYDGLALDGSNSNAAVAIALDLPVILVIDVRGMTRGIAPLLLGYQAFDRSIRIGGVILNRVGGARHEAKLRAVIARYTDVPVLGAVHEDEAIAMLERHLGLMPENEMDGTDELVTRIGLKIADQVDLDAVLSIARRVASRLLSPEPARMPPRVNPSAAVRLGAGAQRLRIGIAMDRAFGFYYCDDLEALCEAGADLIPFDTLCDRSLPAIDALFIGGGFPETCAPGLQANRSLRDQIRRAIESGMPTYAECGGLMYLARSLDVDGQRYEMVGAIQGDVQMHRRPVGRGYVELQPTCAAPFDMAAGTGAIVQAHEFHYSSLSNLSPDTRFAYRVMRGHGIDGKHDGIVHRNMLASYSHLRCGAGSQWAERFVQFAMRVAGRNRREALDTEDSQEWSLAQ